MAFSLDVLESTLDQVKSTLGSISAQKALTEAKVEFEALNTPLVGALAGLQNNGIKALDSVLGDFGAADKSGKNNVALKNSTTKLQNIQFQLDDLQSPIAMMTEQLPNISVKIKPILADAQKTLASAITGSGVQEAFNSVAIALPTAAGLGPAIKGMGADILPTELGDIISKAVGSVDINLQAGLPKDLTSLLSFPKIDLNLGAITSKLDLFGDGLTKAMGDILPKITDLPILDNLHKLNNSVNIIGAGFDFPTNISGIAKKAVSTAVLKKLSDGKLGDVLDLVTKAGAIGDTTSIIAKINVFGIDLGSVSGMLQSPLGGLDITQTNTVNTISGISKGYSVLNSVEEIQMEINASNRSFETVVWHWSASYANQIVTARDIERTSGTVPYHYIIRKNGSVQRGTPLNEVASHGNADIDPKSISVLVIGGYKGLLGENSQLSGESVNGAQKIRINEIMGAIYNVRPGIQMYGHGELDGNYSTLEPGVNIGSLSKSKFNKVNEKIPQITRSHTGNQEGVYQHQGVTRAYSGSIRNRAPTQSLMTTLSSCNIISDLTFVIFSAGQMSFGEWDSYPKSRTRQAGKTYFLDGVKVRQGSRRHDNGWAVDCKVYRGNKKLDFGASVVSDDVMECVDNLFALGATAIGAGPNYMGGNIHIDMAFGNNDVADISRWGAGGKSKNTPRWLANIHGPYT